MTDQDYTKIPIQFDPHERRMTGTTVHGNHAFSAPYITHVVGNLYQGGCTSGLTLPDNIQHIVSLYPWEQYKAKHLLRSNMQIKMYDDQGGVDHDEAISIATWAERCTRDAPTLVHCQAGLNRSGLISGLVLRMQGYGADEAIELLRETRSPAVLCNPTFEKFVQEVYLP
jgi:protein-tyrosine phosphatase